VHAQNSRKLNALGVLMIDLTPAAIGPYCVPPVNLKAQLGQGDERQHGHLRWPGHHSAGGGGVRVQPVTTRNRRHGRFQIGRPRHPQEHRRVHPHHRRRGRKGRRRKKGKAIIIINPAEPPLIMRDTVHCLTESEPDQAAITASIEAMIKEVQKYVPGYKLVNGPVFDGNRVSIFMEVEGLGDYLPKYAGNLDIMTAAAARTAEMFAEEILKGELVCKPPPNPPTHKESTMDLQRQKHHRSRHVPARRHAPQAPPDQSAADEGHRLRPRRGRRAADRSDPRRRPGRQLGELRLPAHTDEEYLSAVIPLMKQAKVSALLLPGIGTVDHLKMAHELGVNTIRVATHCTEADVSEQHIAMARKLGMDTVGFLMMAHMNSPKAWSSKAS
jgi:acetaldehyde/propanal dehydrogenase